MSLPPFRTAPNSGPLPSAGITPRPRYYGPIRQPAGPACPSRGSGCRVHGTDGASRVATHSIFHTCRRHYPGGNQPVVPSLSSRPVGGLPLSCGGSAPAFDVSRPAQRSLHVPARVVAKPPDDLAPPLAVSAVSSFVPFAARSGGSANPVGLLSQSQRQTLELNHRHSLNQAVAPSLLPIESAWTGRILAQDASAIGSQGHSPQRSV